MPVDKGYREARGAGIHEPLGAKMVAALSYNVQIVKQTFRTEKNKDLVVREFEIGDVPACLFFLEGMSASEVMNLHILMPCYGASFDGIDEAERCKMLKNRVISVSDVKESDELDEVCGAVLEGKSVLMVDGCPEALLFDTRGYEKRSVEKADIEKAVLGPQEGFSESMRTNLTLLHRLIHTPRFVSEIMSIGKGASTSCAVVYIDGLANPEVVEEVKRRLFGIDTDIVPGSGHVQQLIEDHPMALIPQMITTERPDRAASFLMDGQVAVICDGTPLLLAMPCTFFHLLHTADDTFMRWQNGSFIRIIRLLGALFSLFLPAFYMAISIYHHEVLPTELLTSIVESHSTVPFPMLVEVLVMELSFDLIQEAGIRMPGAIGSVLGIIGALILGQAGVAAGVVSPILIIVVAITGLGNFAIPDYSLAVSFRLLRLMFIAAAAVGGFLGMSLAAFVCGVYLCGMRSFGVPFISPVSPPERRNRDIFVRFPLYKQVMRMFWVQKIFRKRSKGEESRAWKEK